MLKIGKNRTQISPGIKIGQGVFFSQGNSVQPPAAPVATSASQVDYFDFLANWSASTGATGYYLDVSTQSDFSSYVTGFENLDVGNNTSYFVDTLNSNTTYYYRVRAYDLNGTSANSNVISTSTLAFVLDDQPTAAGAFSFRILRGAYYQTSGALLTIRRDSDNAEETFYPTRADGYTLTLSSETSGGTPLSTWIGANNGFIKTWYGQGAVNNFEITNATLQPQIINAGAFITQDGLPALDFDGSKGLTTTNGYILELSTNACTFFIVRNIDNTANGEYLLTEGDQASPYSSNIILGGPAGSGVVAWVNTQTFGTVAFGQQLLGFNWDTVNFQAYTNGATNGASGTPTVNAEALGVTSLGIRPDLTTSFFTGKVQEIICFKTDNSGARTTIDNNINNYYSIY